EVGSRAHRGDTKPIPGSASCDGGKSAAPLGRLRSEGPWVGRQHSGGGGSWPVSSDHASRSRGSARWRITEHRGPSTSATQGAPWRRGTATFDGRGPSPAHGFPRVAGVFHAWGPAVSC